MRGGRGGLAEEVQALAEAEAGALGARGAQGRGGEREGGVLGGGRDQSFGLGVEFAFDAGLVARRGQGRGDGGEEARGEEQVGGGAAGRAAQGEGVGGGLEVARGELRGHEEGKVLEGGVHALPEAAQTLVVSAFQGVEPALQASDHAVEEDEGAVAEVVAQPVDDLPRLGEAAGRGVAHREEEVGDGAGLGARRALLVEDLAQQLLAPRALLGVVGLGEEPAHAGPQHSGLAVRAEREGMLRRLLVVGGSLGVAPVPLQDLGARGEGLGGAPAVAQLAEDAQRLARVGEGVAVEVGAVGEQVGAVLEGEGEFPGQVEFARGAHGAVGDVADEGEVAGEEDGEEPDVGRGTAGLRQAGAVDLGRPVQPRALRGVAPVVEVHVHVREVDEVHAAPGLVEDGAVPRRGVAVQLSATGGASGAPSAKGSGPSAAAAPAQCTASPRGPRICQYQESERTRHSTSCSSARSRASRRARRRFSYSASRRAIAAPCSGPRRSGSVVRASSR